MPLSPAPVVGEINLTAVLVAIAAVSLAYLVYLLDEKPYKGFPVVGLEKDGFFRMAKARSAWIVNGCDILAHGAKQFPDAFQVITASGPKIVLPNRYAHEIRNNPHMSFGKIITREFFSSYPGFEPFGTLNQHNIIQDVIKNKLTQSLTHYTEDISAEITTVLSELLPGDPGTTTTLPLRSLIARAIGQVTSRVFLGAELSRNVAWQNLCTSYAVAGFAAQQALLSWSPILRPLVYRFLPACRQLRALTGVGRGLIGPYIQAARERARGDGKERAGERENMVGWMEEVARERAGGKFDVADAQIMLSIAAIHTTSEAFVWVIADLIEHSGYVEPLREEVKRVLGEDGGSWGKTSLYRMKLLDSFIKESHRRHMVDALVMDRHVEKTVTLSDGLTLPAGSALMVHATNNVDETFWPNAKEFDGYRFMKLRAQAGEENRHQLVTTSVEHLGFGLGSHACPGRFFAANAMKVLLAQFVMKYDWKFVDEKPQLRAAFGSSVYVNPTLTVAATRRKEEVNV